MARAELPVDTDHEAIDGEMEIESTVPLVPAAPPVLSDRDHAALGRAERVRVSRRALGEFEPAEARQDPVAILESQETTRVPELVPIRHARMAMSPLAFYRGAAAIMAADLATGPRTALRVQLCGDAHLSNFGVFASPERNLVFDLNDFDETLPGPFEWDVKRLAASFEIAGRENGFSTKQRRAIVLAGVAGYRSAMREFAGQPNLAVWYAHFDIDRELEAVKTSLAPTGAKRAEAILAKARTRDNMQAFSKLATVVDAKPQLVSDPPLIVRVTDLMPEEDAEELFGRLRELLSSYRRTLPSDRRHLLEQYRLVDMARKVVGVGSVGARAWILLMEGVDGEDPLFLQAKEAQASVLEAFVGASAYTNHGQRVVAGQPLMQAASDIFLGWQRTEGIDGVRRDYYVRQLRDWKASVEIEQTTPKGLSVYARMCGWTL